MMIVVEDDPSIWGSGGEIGRNRMSKTGPK